jgi:tRNA(adenine34) deaminase
MRAALLEAERAFELGEVPIGCVIHHLPTGQRFCGHNLRETERDPSAHAEIVAMRLAARALGSWRLVDCILAVTLEPCPMCAGAVINARIPHVVYGASDPKAGAVESLFQLLTDQRLNHRCRVTEGVEVEACRSVLRKFFLHQRALGKK